MKKLLTICPSRGRPYKLLEMIASFRNTTFEDHTDLMVLLDNDDDFLGVYLEKMPAWVRFEIFDRSLLKTKTTEIINLAFEKYKYQYEFFSVTNDDFEYLTYGWDLRLCGKGRICTGFEPNMFAKNGIKTLGFPVTSVIDRDICDAVGYLQYPELNHCGGDNVWWWIGKRLKILYFDPEVTVIHKNPFLVNVEIDQVFEDINNSEMLKKESAKIKYWLKYKINEDLEKIKDKGLCYA